MKLRLDFAEVWLFYRHSDFTWNQIWVNSNSLKMSFLAIFRDSELWNLVNLELKNWSFFCQSDFYVKSNFGNFKWSKNVIFGNFRGSDFQVPNLPKIQSSEFLHLPKMVFLDCLNSPKLDFTQNLSGSKIIVKYSHEIFFTSNKSCKCVALTKKRESKFL